MAAPRKFDHDEARALHAGGESKAALARRYGVSWNAIHWALDAAARAKMHAYGAAYNRVGVCADCGRACTRMSHPSQGGHGVELCNRCSKNGRQWGDVREVLRRVRVL